MKNLFYKFLNCIVLVVALSVMVGWAFDIEILKSVYIGAVTMKFTTAWLFVLSSLALCRFNIRCLSLTQVFCSYAILLTIFLIMYETTISKGFSVFEDTSEYTVREGMPSIGTLFGFFTFSCCCIFAKKHVIKATRLVLKLVGATAIAGHIMDKPPFYFHFPEISSGMAFHTASLFVVMGFILAYKQSEFEKEKGLKHDSKTH